MTTRLAIALSLLVGLTGCASSGKEPQQKEQSLSAKNIKVDVEDTTKKNSAKVAEMSSGATSRTTNFKFYNKTGYRISMYIKSPYGEWHGDLDPWGNTVWTPIPHDGTVWTWAYGYDSAGNQVLYWESSPSRIRPGVEWYTMDWNN